MIKLDFFSSTVFRDNKVRRSRIMLLLRYKHFKRHNLLDGKSVDGACDNHQDGDEDLELVGVRAPHLASESRVRVDVKEILSLVNSVMFMSVYEITNFLKITLSLPPFCHSFSKVPEMNIEHITLLASKLFLTTFAWPHFHFTYNLTTLDRGAGDSFCWIIEMIFVKYDSIGYKNKIFFDLYFERTHS